MNKIPVVLSITLCVAIGGCSQGLRVKEYKLSESHGVNHSTNGYQFYTIGAGDGLAVNVWQEPTLSGSVKVRPDGYITLPLVNEIHVTGMTTTKLRNVLEKKYKDFLTNPTVTIRVESIISSQVFLIGQITNPGAYPFTGEETVIQLITRAGGPTIFAKRRNIRVLRRNGTKVTEYIVDYDSIINGDLQQDIYLRPGDRVVVP